MGVNNIQPSKYACQKSCQENSNCDFWTWGKSGPTKGRCYLKDARENLTPTDEYMSGSKQCKIPDNPGKICPPGYFGEPPNCECSVDNIAYMGNNIVMGVNNIQPSKYACQKSCQDNSNCDFWTWGKSGPTKGRCYLKDARENLTPTDDYMSGSKQCKIPNDPGKPCKDRETGITHDHNEFWWSLDGCDYLHC